MHRLRQGFVVERTAIANRLRGLMSEFGVVMALRSVTVRRQAVQAAEGLPELARGAIGDLLEQLRVLDTRIGAYDEQIHAQAKLFEPARRLMPIRGFGATTALAIVATVGNEQARRRQPARADAGLGSLQAAEERRNRPLAALRMDRRLGDSGDGWRRAWFIGLGEDRVGGPGLRAGLRRAGGLRVLRALRFLVARLCPRMALLRSPAVAPLAAHHRRGGAGAGLEPGH